jgi:hypothetical protein
MPPELIAPLVAEEVARVGGREVSILLQDYEQVLLVPLPGRRLKVGGPESVEDSPAGEAFLGRRTVEVPQDGSVRMYLPLLDGSDQIGVMAVTLDRVDDDDRRRDHLPRRVERRRRRSPRHPRLSATMHRLSRWGLPPTWGFARREERVRPVASVTETLLCLRTRSCGCQEDGRVVRGEGRDGQGVEDLVEAEPGR